MGAATRPEILVPGPRRLADPLHGFCLEARLDIVASVRRSPTLAVQLVNYRTRSYLDRCLATVIPDLDASGIDYQVNLLDNASGETLDDLLQEFPGCRTFSSERNLGFGGGHNLLASKVGSPYLLILNPDVEFISPNTGLRLLSVLRTDETIKVVGPKLIALTGQAQAYDHGRLRGPRAQLAVRGGDSYWRATNVAQDVAWVSGAALLVEHAMFARVDGFDENLFLYKEDEDLCLRIRRAGGRVFYEPSVVVRHHGGVVADRMQEMAPAVDYFLQKHLLTRPSHRLLRAAHQCLAYLRL